MLVSNTSTLVLLAKVKCLETFINMPVKIEIPNQVREEAFFYPKSDYAHLINKLIIEKRIQVVSVNKDKVNKDKVNKDKVNKDKVNNIMSQFNLDEGEAAAYILYNKKHKVILTDDGELIKLCKLSKTPFICAMAIVIRLFERNKLSKEEAVDKLKKLYEIGRYSEALYNHFKKEIK